MPLGRHLAVVVVVVVVIVSSTVVKRSRRTHARTHIRVHYTHVDTRDRQANTRSLAHVHPPARHGEVNRPPCLRIIHTGWGLDTVNRCQSFLREDTVHEEPALLPHFFFLPADRLDFRS